MAIELPEIIENYKSDKESVFNTWFINNDQRLKAFRLIDCGVQRVIDDIRSESFGDDFKGSSLELVLNAITEQKQVFTGAAHAFYWKPKLGIPDIYENEENKLAFGRFLENCCRATTAARIMDEIEHLDQHRIKGLGPAVANILYFLHPDKMPPSNTAIVKGFNRLFKDKVKLGSWPEYLRMRRVIVAKNDQYSNILCGDLGAFAGLLFDVGSKKIIVGDEGALSDAEQLKIEKIQKKRHREVMAEKDQEDAHSEMQYHLLKIGKALGYDVISAPKDRSKCHDGNNFSAVSLANFPEINVDKETRETVELIDVVWFEHGTSRIASAFEVEKTTSLCSGILRLADLYYSFPSDPSSLFLVIPDDRKPELRRQFRRPSIKKENIEAYYVLFSDLRKYCDGLCKLGEDRESLKKIATRIS